MWSCSFCVFRVFSSGPYPFRNNLLKGHCKTFFFFDPVALILFCAVVLITAVTNWISCVASCVSFPLRWLIWHTERLSSWIRSFSSSIQQLTVRKQLNFSIFYLLLLCLTLCPASRYVPPLQKKSTSNTQRNSSASSSMKRPTTPYRYVA